MTIYGDHAGLYLRAGWMSPLPLPEGLKATPPDDTTGNKPYATSDDIEHWCENQPEANLGLRMGTLKIDGVPHEVIGIECRRRRTRGAESRLVVPLPQDAVCA